MTDVLKQIDAQVKANDVVLFLKGTKESPMCGFSGRVVQILNHVGVPYTGVNVLDDEGIRQGIKDYANWPTIPQLYVKGEFVGEGTLKLFRVNSDPLPKEIENPGRKLTIDMQAEGWIFKTVAGPGVSR